MPNASSSCVIADSKSVLGIVSIEFLGPPLQIVLWLSKTAKQIKTYMQSNLLSKAQDMLMILTKIATGQDKADYCEYYKFLRLELISSKAIKVLLPDFVTSSRVLDDFWPYIKSRFSTYAERREYLREQFEPLLAYLEEDMLLLHDSLISDSISKFDCDSVKHMWEKALVRRETDPDGAITAARSLLESVCKQILVENNISYDDGCELPKLFKLTVRSLNLAPELHNEEIIKQILGGVQTTVHGFASLRNRLSDAHGQPKGGYRAGKRHAEFAVDLAGSTASFLIQTHQEALLKG